MFCLNPGRIDLDADEGRNVVVRPLSCFGSAFRTSSAGEPALQSAIGDFHQRVRRPRTRLHMRVSRISIIAWTKTEVQCDATIQATTIRPDTSTIVRPWVSSQRRTWRRVLRILGDENRSASRPIRPPSVWRIAPL